MSAQDPQWVDDFMDVADAMGVTAPAGAQILVHPSMRRQLPQGRLDEVLEAWSYAAAGIDPEDLPIGLVPVEDHAPCEGDDCSAVICMCHGGSCADTVEQACSHHSLLCDEHRLDCPDCRDDYRADRNDGRWI